MEYPDDILYSKDHEWIKIEDDFVFIGITNFAQRELGDIVYVEIETLGEKLNQNDVFGTIEAVKTVSDLFLPLSGEIIEINPKIISNPELVNDVPFGDGWLAKIISTENKRDEEISELLLNVEYMSLIGIE
jgi:glycine cleavage system H protein